ncbi:MAG: hypothetical protein JSS34_04590 [Proteobacteria bacterium]|nr:hypothetical protein [Pseudomonadota bacterium]
MYLKLLSFVFAFLAAGFVDAMVVTNQYLGKAPENVRIRKNGTEIPNGGAGIYLYGNVKGDICLLIGREKGSIYCPLAGSSQFKERNIPESFEETARRELWEESATLYSVQPEDLKNGDFYFQENKSGGQYLLILLKTSKILHTKDLVDAQKNLKKECYLEKENLVWIPFQVLLKKKKGENKLVYKGQIFPLQKQFAHLCDEDSFRSLLKSILQKANHNDNNIEKKGDYKRAAF